MRSRQRSQALVEFGIIAITFTLIMFAIADFGLLLNDWLAVSSGSRGVARDAAAGMIQNELVAETRLLKIPGVGGDPHFTGGYCCGPNAALVLSVVYYDQCTPGVIGVPCNKVAIGELDSAYWSDGVRGGCALHPNCLHPSPPKAGACHGNPAPSCPGDSVVLTLTAAGAQVITPLVRPFFTSNTGECPDSDHPSHCYVSVSSSVTMRFEGDML